MTECHIHRTKSLNYTAVATSKLAHHYFQTIQLLARDEILHQDTKILSTKLHHTDHILKKSIQSQLNPDVKRVKVPISSWSRKPPCKTGQGLLKAVNLFLARLKPITCTFCPSAHHYRDLPQPIGTASRYSGWLTAPTKSEPI
jgi:hypothetical protein